MKQMCTITAPTRPRGRPLHIAASGAQVRTPLICASHGGPEPLSIQSIVKHYERLGASSSSSSAMQEALSRPAPCRRGRLLHRCPLSGARARLQHQKRTHSRIGDAALQQITSNGADPDGPSTSPARCGDITENFYTWGRYNARICYRKAEQASSTAPAILFLHGFGVGSYHYDKQLAGLSPRFRCFSVCLLGQGRAACPCLGTCSLAAAPRAAG